MPVPKPPAEIKRTVEALRRLGITQKALAAAPEITPLLKNADGGLTQVMMAMRFAPDEIISAYLDKYDKLPVGDRERLPMEAIALAAGIDITHLLGSIMVCLQAQAVNAVKIIAMTAHPRIAQARVAYGQLPWGDKDRTALDTAMGFLPSPKGPTFIGKAVFGGRDDDEDDDSPDMDRLFPPVNTMQEKLNPIRQKLLTEG